MHRGETGDNRGGRWSERAVGGSRIVRWRAGEYLRSPSLGATRSGDTPVTGVEEPLGEGVPRWSLDSGYPGDTVKLQVPGAPSPLPQAPSLKVRLGR